jgi:predicted  nucleic acid-binding Zn-ribbon protein
MHSAGLKNEEYVSKLNVSGSNAVKRKNDAGVNLFESYDLYDGVIPGKLVRPKYNTEELGKAIDTRIFELIPQDAPIGPATVLRSTYQDALDEISALSAENTSLSNEINNLRSTISSLNSTIRNLEVQLDGESLKASVSENQAEVAAETIADTTIDLQNAIQNATQEAIQRVSLTARNEALKEQINALLKSVSSLETQVNNEVTKRNQIQAANQAAATQAQQQAAQVAAQAQQQAASAAQTAAAVASGAALLGSSVFIKNLKQPSGSDKDITITSNHKSGPNSIKFTAGDKFEIENAGTTAIAVTVSKGGDAVNFLKNSITNTSVPPKSKKTINFSVNTSWWSGQKPKSTIFASAKTYNGTMTIKASNGTEQTFNVMLRKNVKS